MSLSTPIDNLRRGGDTSSTPNFSLDTMDFAPQTNNQMNNPISANFESLESESNVNEDHDYNNKVVPN